MPPSSTRRRGGPGENAEKPPSSGTGSALCVAVSARSLDPPAPPHKKKTHHTRSLLTTLDDHLAFLLWTLIIGTGLLGVPTVWLAVALFARSGAGLLVALVTTAAAAWAAATPLPPDDGRRPPPWAEAFCRYLITRSVRILNPRPDGSPGLAVRCAPGAAASIAALAASSTPMLVATEPHSTLPMGMLLAFHPHAQHLLPPHARPPPALVGARILASSACFAVPLVRHVWWWLGVRPADRASVRAGFAAARAGRGPPALALCPGGVAEVAFLTPTPRPPAPKTETLFLRSRTGFVREALRSGASLVPAFTLGQTSMFSWTPPPLLPRRALKRLARAVGFMPLWVHNGWGAPLPRRDARLTVLVGAGLVAREGVDAVAAGEDPEPEPATVTAVRDDFIEALCGLVEQMKGGVAGEEATRVVVV